MKKFYVYIHTCPNGKKYVGVTGRDPESRWKEGKGYKHQLFGKAILKYGWDNITHEVFEVESEEEMYRKEVELISFYHSNDPNFGYNLSSGGEKSALGCIRSEEFRKKLSESHKGKPHPHKPFSEEHRKHLSEVRKGKPHSEEHKRHISEALKGRTNLYLKGRLNPHSEETRKKLSEAQKKKWLDPEYREKMSKAWKGKPHKPFSEEARKHMSEAHKGKPKPRVKIKLPDGTIIEVTKNNLVKDYVNKGKKFEYVS